MSTLKSPIAPNTNVGAVRHPKLKLTQTRKCILHNLGTKRNVMRLVQSITFFPSFLEISRPESKRPTTYLTT